jgi:hypothetical protein
MSGSVVGALRLRGLTLKALSGSSADTGWETALQASASTWLLFLRAERCAILFERCLESSGRLQHLPPKIRNVMRQRARDEQTRVLSARS